MAAGVPSPRTLNASTRHTRKESLSMLKTRMEDELGVEDLASAALLSPRSEGGRSPGAGHGSGGLHTRSAVLGVDLVWCAECKGDLWVI